MSGGLLREGEAGNGSVRVLIIGSRGQLGADCVTVMAGRHDVVGLDLPEIDIACRASVRRALDAVHPQTIVNCAAYTAVDACESDATGLPQRVNVDGPRLLAEAAKRGGARLVHLSTDYVFDGCRPPPSPYRESDSTGPLSRYGRTKLDGEIAIRESMTDFVIARTAWLYGRTGANFPKTILRAALKRPDRPLRVVNDQRGSATWSLRLAEQLLCLVESDAQGV